MPEPQTPPNPPRPNKRRSRRQAPRTSTKARAFRNALGVGPNIAVAVLDLSETGVRLLLKEALPPGHEFEVRLETWSRSITVIARVIWSTATTDGNFCVGSSFQKSIPWADLSALARL